MKKTILVFAASTIMSALIFSSCNDSQRVENSQEKVTEAQQDLARAENEYRDDMDAYRRDINARIDANERTIDELKEQKRYKEGSDKDAYRMRIEELKQKNRDLRRRMNDYQASGKDDWERFKAEFNRDMDELGQAFKNLGTDNVK